MRIRLISLGARQSLSALRRLPSSRIRGLIVDAIDRYTADFDGTLPRSIE